MTEPEWFDVVVVGGGPAGLSGALVLGRACRRVLLCDAGDPRNAPVPATHGFFTRDGAAPEDLRRAGRAQLARYGVAIRERTVQDLARRDDGRGFDVQLAGAELVHARKALVATGVRDVLPDVPGFAELHGRGVYHCPYCDGWEVRARPLLAVASGDGAAEYALALLPWSPDVVLATHGAPAPAGADGARLKRYGIDVCTAPIARVEEAATARAPGTLHVTFADGSTTRRRALFVDSSVVQRSELVARLGVPIGPKGTVDTDRLARTPVPGVFVAGDASHDVQWISVAVAEGAKAAMAINIELRREDFP
jgi:thioredoxin reductase